MSSRPYRKRGGEVWRATSATGRPGRRALRGRVRRLRYAADLDQHRGPGVARADPAAGPRAEHGRHREAPDRQYRVADRTEARKHLPPALLGAAAAARL